MSVAPEWALVATGSGADDVPGVVLEAGNTYYLRLRLGVAIPDWAVGLIEAALGTLGTVTVTAASGQIDIQMEVT